MDEELGGGQNFENLLTTSSRERSDSTRKRRGPLSEFGDQELQNRRDQLVQVFEGLWGDLGRELEKCKKAQDLISALAPLSQTFAGRTIEIFLRQSDEKPSGTRLKKLRTQYRSLTKPSYKTDEAKRTALDRLQQVNGAMTSARKRDVTRVRRERTKRRKEYAKAELADRVLRAKVGENERQLRLVEASVARYELLKFLRSPRYELNPLHLANAMAGLPYMGWRRSMQRTRPVPSLVANGLTYRSFKAIRYLLGSARRKDVVGLRDRFREGIPLLVNRFGNDAREELANDWIYLEKAIQHTCKLKPHPKDFPFEIMKKYMKLRNQPKSSVDLVLAQQARIPLPSPRRKLNI